MRLINANTYRLVKDPKDGNGNSAKYAILSHRWPAEEEEEVIFADMHAPHLPRHKPGFQKIDLCCKQANLDGLEYVWIDTCTIDKSSSAELQEAINSMYRWYQQASVCYAYLKDLEPVHSLRMRDRPKDYELKDLGPEHSLRMHDESEDYELSERPGKFGQWAAAHVSGSFDASEL